MGEGPQARVVPRPSRFRCEEFSLVARVVGAPAGAGAAQLRGARASARGGGAAMHGWARRSAAGREGSDGKHQAAARPSLSLASGRWRLRAVDRWPPRGPRQRLQDLKSRRGNDAVSRRSSGPAKGGPTAAFSGHSMDRPSRRLRRPARAAGPMAPNARSPGWRRCRRGRAPRRGRRRPRGRPRDPGRSVGWPPAAGPGRPDRCGCRWWPRCGGRAGRRRGRCVVACATPTLRAARVAPPPPRHLRCGRRRR